MRADYEKPVAAVMDYLLQRNDVDPGKIALYGLSLSSQLAARAVAYEKRINACILNGGPIVDVNEAWEAVRPPFVKKTIPGVWDYIFGIVMKVSAQFAGFVNHFMWSFGVSTLREVLDAFVPFTIKGLAPMIHCPTLILVGEAEYAQTDKKTMLSALRFISELTCPTTIHEFGIDKDGWAASHCQIGGVNTASVVIFDWLDKTLNNKDQVTTKVRLDWSMVKKYHGCKELNEILESMPDNVVSSNID